MRQKVCVYCGAAQNLAPVYQEAATDLGELIANEGMSLVYGGGRLGLMGIVADAVVENGGNVIGITTELLDDREGAHSGIQELHVVDSMHTRKMRMSEEADVFVILPGGYGTLDEFFEILTWRQLGIHTKPIIILNIHNYWAPLLNLLHGVIDQGFAKMEHRKYITVLDRVDLVADAVRRL